MKSLIVRDGGLGLSFHPTARHKVVRFVDAEPHRPSRARAVRAAQRAAPHLAAAFVDPPELSFRTFENIVPLDRGSRASRLALDSAGTRGARARRVHLHPRRARRAREPRSTASTRSTCTCRRSTRRRAAGAVHLPLGAARRGAHDSGKRGDAGRLDGFSHVNPVFRCNRFEPGDARLHRHHDTPYYDAARGTRVALHGASLPHRRLGRAGARPRRGDAAFDTIEPLTCVVFDQRYEHEGAPFRDGRKVFLRTDSSSPPVRQSSTTRRSPRCSARRATGRARASSRPSSRGTPTPTTTRSPPRTGTASDRPTRASPSCTRSSAACTSSRTATTSGSPRARPLARRVRRDHAAGLLQLQARRHRLPRPCEANVSRPTRRVDPRVPCRRDGSAARGAAVRQVRTCSPSPRRATAPAARSTPA